MSSKIFLHFNLEPLNRILYSPSSAIPISTCLGCHPKLCVIIGLSLLSVFPISSSTRLCFLPGSPISLFHENRHFKIPIESSTRNLFGFVNTLTIFSELKSVANFTKNCHVNIFAGKTDMIFH